MPKAGQSGSSRPVGCMCVQPDMVVTERSQVAHINGPEAADGKPFDIGADTFDRGLCLPSNNKAPQERQ